eukprot:CAMPEP_0181231868 /NCGR_PEP_ID=MMETSP1096-20121128/35372_1 /TAXON_ID=156174 ORGANISM="Chrysochromulina ericina, Strain CCMP281" /NCGR_SAMPLE_ID=MMETSP1096 /ASSEMBLY_ACC=CAM_ASM_000453 /LENGTH=64 /DNA_ID=CAMNT_0023326011 /DNA_START=156 /DNA_END=350 /DNA_ORIENTATION=-
MTDALDLREVVSVQKARLQQRSKAPLIYCWRAGHDIQNGAVWQADDGGGIVSRAIDDQVGQFEW